MEIVTDRSRQDFWEHEKGRGGMRVFFLTRCFHGGEEQSLSISSRKHQPAGGKVKDVAWTICRLCRAPPVYNVSKVQSNDQAPQSHGEVNRRFFFLALDSSPSLLLSTSQSLNLSISTSLHLSISPSFISPSLHPFISPSIPPFRPASSSLLSIPPVLVL